MINAEYRRIKLKIVDDYIQMLEKKTPPNEKVPSIASQNLRQQLGAEPESRCMCIKL